MSSSQFVRTVSLKRDKIDSFDRHPFSLPAVHSLTSLELHPQVTFFIGENGSGKSTLLEAMAVSLGFNPEGGSKNFAFGTRASHSELHSFLRIAKGVRRPRTGYFLRAESFFNVATEIERLDDEPSFGPKIIASYGNRSLHEQSHGESFMALVENRFGAEGLYILDEPEAALSPQRQLRLLARMHALVNKGSQFIIATHSPILMAYPHASIFQCAATGLVEIGYEQTEHYKVTKAFLADPKRMLRVLMDEQSQNDGEE